MDSGASVPWVGDAERLADVRVAGALGGAGARLGEEAAVVGGCSTGGGSVTGSRSATAQPIRNVVPAANPSCGAVSRSCSAERHQRTPPGAVFSSVAWARSTPQSPTLVEPPAASVTA